MSRPIRVIAALVAAGLLSSGCYGPFTLTRKVYNWNGNVSQDKWAVEVLFLLLNVPFLSVYGLAITADAIFFNSVVFWTGNNILNTNASMPPTRRIVRGDHEVVMTRVADDELLMESFTAGQPQGSVRLRREDGGIVALGPDGRLLMRSSARADGSLVVADAQGRTVASLSARDVEQSLASIQ